MPVRVGHVQQQPLPTVVEQLAPLQPARPVGQPAKLPLELFQVPVQPYGHRRQPRIAQVGHWPRVPALPGPSRPTGHWYLHHCLQAIVLAHPQLTHSLWRGRECWLEHVQTDPAGPSPEAHSQRLVPARSQIAQPGQPGRLELRQVLPIVLGLRAVFQRFHAGHRRWHLVRNPAPAVV